MLHAKTPIAVSVVLGALMLTSPRTPCAEPELPWDLQLEIQQAMDAREESEDGCLLQDGIARLVRSNPGMAVAIADQASQRLLPSRAPILGGSCVCPVEIAVGSVSSAPEVASEVERVLVSRFISCDTTIYTALRDTLAKLPPTTGTSLPLQTRRTLTPTDPPFDPELDSLSSVEPSPGSAITPIFY